MSIPPGRSPEARPIGEIMRRLLQRKRFYQRGRYSGLTEAWAAVVGENIAAHTRIRDFKDGCLIIGVQSAVLRHELDGFLKAGIVSALQETKAGRDVADMRFCLDNGADGAATDTLGTTGKNE